MADEIVNEEPEQPIDTQQIESTNPTPEVGKAYTDMLLLYQDISVWNQGRTFGFSNNIMAVVQQLLLNYNEQCIAYLEDETEDKSILQHLTSDGLEQYDFHKGIYTTYNVYLF